MKNIFTCAIVLLFTLPAFHLCYGQNISLNLRWQKKGTVNTMKFSPDARLLITGGTIDCDNCGEIQVWRVKDGVLTTAITKETLGVTNAIDISKDGRTILSGHGSVYCSGGGEGGDCDALWGSVNTHLVNGEEKRFLNAADIIYSIAYTPDNSVIAAGTGYNDNNTGEIRMYDSNFNLLRVLPGHRNENSETNGLAFTPDGKYLVSGGSDGNVKIWEYKTGALVRTMVHGDYLNGGTYLNIDVSPNGQYIASAGRGYNMVTKIWRVTDGALLYTLPLHGSYGNNIAKFSPDGKYVVSGTAQYTVGPWLANILVWRLSDGALIEKITDTTGAPFGGIKAMAFSPDRKYFAYSIIGTLKVFSLNNTNIATASDTAAKMQLSNASFHSTAYPNPFTSFISFNYNLPFKQHVLLAIYDAGGRGIAILKNDMEDAGVHSVSFNAEKLDRGIYVYKIQTQTYSETGKIIATK
jgi:WD40 repeat protein